MQMNISIEGKLTAGSNSNGKHHSTNNLIHRIRNGALQLSLSVFRWVFVAFVAVEFFPQIVCISFKQFELCPLLHNWRSVALCIHKLIHLHNMVCAEWDCDWLMWQSDLFIIACYDFSQVNISHHKTILSTSIYNLVLLDVCHFHLFLPLQ